jgi:uncharacterized membrane protein
MHNAVDDCICVRFLVVFVQHTDRQAAKQHCQVALALQPNHLWLLRLQVSLMLCVCLSVLCVSITRSLLSLEAATLSSSVCVGMLTSLDCSLEQQLQVHAPVQHMSMYGNTDVSAHILMFFM